MTSYNLRNGIVIADVQWGPFSLNTGVGTELVDLFVADKLNRASLKCRTGIAGQVAGISVKVKTLIKNANEDVLSNNTMAFMQIVEIDHGHIFYAGQNEKDCGSSDITCQGKLLDPMMDCLTDPLATTAPTYPFYRQPIASTVSTLNGFESSFDDSPQEMYKLYMLNPLVGDPDKNGKPSGKWNFLKFGRNLTKFTILLVFVHQDNSFELIEGWRWSLQRDFDMTWTKSKPLVSQEGAVLKIDEGKTVVFGLNGPAGSNININTLIAGGSVANIVGNAALTNLTTDPNIKLSQSTTNTGFNPSFFTP